MYKNNLSLLLFFCSYFGFELKAQSIMITERCSLPLGEKESSGLCTINGGKTFWTINDSDRQAQLYEFDSLGTAIRTVTVENASNIDWEEITTDPEGNIYIGDFGNNDNNRKDQKIYIVKNTDLLHSNIVSAEIINIRYANQNQFPPIDLEKNFDMEAMIFLKGKLHLFSKNRTNPFSGYTYEYIIDSKPGQYTVSPIDSFKTGPGPMLFFWVTGAAISADYSQMILLSHDRIWLFYPLNPDFPLKSPVKQVTLNHFSQKEGICFSDPNRIWITDEVNTTINNGGKLYSADLSSVLSASNLNQKILRPVYFVHEILNLDIGPIDVLEILDLEGRKILSKELLDSNSIHLESLIAGVYFAIIKTGKTIQKILIHKD
jgi:hypothetical protein